MNLKSKTETTATVEFERISEVYDDLSFIDNMSNLFGLLSDAKARNASESIKIYTEELDDNIYKLSEFFSELVENIKDGKGN